MSFLVAKGGSGLGVGNLWGGHQHAYSNDWFFSS